MSTTFLQKNNWTPPRVFIIARRRGGNTPPWNQFPPPHQKPIPPPWLSKFFSYALLATVLLILPLFYRNNDLASWSHHRLLGLVGGVFFYFSLLQFKLSKKESHFFLYVILGGVVIESILGISQYYFFPKDNWMGYDTNQNFPYGVFQQKNMMGIFMVTGCAISLYLLKNDQEFSQFKIASFLLLFMPFSSSIILIAIKSKSAFLSYLFFFF